MPNTVDVSVAILTYFHENYIRMALDSVLQQKTVYSYEIVVGDDCSTDKTREILNEYKNRYPDIIQLIFNEENVGISTNNYNVRMHCRGRYIATLSGDDYWIDNEKIQKQVDFLESHPEYYAVATSIQGRFDFDEVPFSVYPDKKLRGASIDLHSYCKGAIFGTNGMMMRNAYLTPEGREQFSMVKRASRYIDDATECILVLMNGPVYVLKDECVVYRVCRNSQGKNNFNSQYSTLDKCKKSIELYNNLDYMLNGDVDLLYFYTDHLAVAFSYSLLFLKFDDYKRMVNSIPRKYRRGIEIHIFPRVIKLSVKKLCRVVKSHL